MSTGQTAQGLTARDIMTPAPRNGSVHSSVLEIVMIMRDADCGSVPIIQESKVVGIVTDRDIALALSEHPDLGRRPVSEIMTKDVVTVAPDASVAEIRQQMANHAIRRMVVAEADGTLVGIISWADLSPTLPDQAVGRVVSNVVEKPSE